MVSSPELSTSFNCMLSDELWFDDDNDSEFVWLSNTCLLSSSTSFIIGDTIFVLLSNTSLACSILFFNIWPNDDLSYVLLLCWIE